MMPCLKYILIIVSAQTPDLTYIGNSCVLYLTCSSTTGGLDKVYCCEYGHCASPHWNRRHYVQHGQLIWQKRSVYIAAPLGPHAPKLKNVGAQTNVGAQWKIWIILNGKNYQQLQIIGLRSTMKLYFWDWYVAYIWPIYHTYIYHISSLLISTQVGSDQKCPYIQYTKQCWEDLLMTAEIPWNTSEDYEITSQSKLILRKVQYGFTPCL